MVVTLNKKKNSIRSVIFEARYDEMSRQWKVWIDYNFRKVEVNINELKKLHLNVSDIPWFASDQLF